jgi:hypothetical protein
MGYGGGDGAGLCAITRDNNRLHTLIAEAEGHLFGDFRAVTDRSRLPSGLGSAAEDAPNIAALMRDHEHAVALGS